MTAKPRKRHVCISGWTLWEDVGEALYLKEPLDLFIFVGDLHFLNPFLFHESFHSAIALVNGNNTQTRRRH